MDYNCLKTKLCPMCANVYIKFEYVNFQLQTHLMLTYNIALPSR